MEHIPDASKIKAKFFLSAFKNRHICIVVNDNFETRDDAQERNKHESINECNNLAGQERERQTFDSRQ